MAKFVYIYSGGKMPETPEEGQQFMAAWGAWAGGLGAAISDGGNAFGASTSVSSSGASGSGSAGGYSIITAESLEDAARKAEGNPVVAAGGKVDVYETIDM
jgi:hypothetical protein